MGSSGNYNQMIMSNSSSSPTNYDTSSCCNGTDQADDEYSDLRRGPWTMEEDLVLVNYINIHGEGRWNALARCAGLKRTGKSCRLRWLNYLRPDVRRGNITPEEQLLILELHSRWGNRWSKIAQHLPGRTDNEIKNYWRTRVQKHAKQLQCDVNSKQFQDAMRYLWMPRLIERIKADRAQKDAAAAAAMTAPVQYSSFSTAASTTTTQVPQITASSNDHTTSSSPEIESVVNTLPEIQMPPSSSLIMMHDHLILQAGSENNNNNMEEYYNYFGTTIYNTSDSTTCYSDFPAATTTTGLLSGSCYDYQQFSGQFGVFPSDQISTTNISYYNYFDNNVNNYMEGNLSSSDQSLWSSENMWLLEQQLCEEI